jgi:DNA replication protein DnaC
MTLDQLMSRLRKAREENPLERILAQFSYPKVLILKEIGYLPISRDEAIYSSGWSPVSTRRPA